MRMRAAVGVTVCLVGAAVVLGYAGRRSRADDPPRPAPVYGYDVVATYPHDGDAFTEGLLYRDGSFYESTGLEGESTLRQVDVQTGRVVRRYDLPREIFGEGLTDWGATLVQLTYTTKVAFVYDLQTFVQRIGAARQAVKKEPPEFRLPCLMESA